MKQTESILFKYITLEKFQKRHPNVDVNDLPEVSDKVDKIIVGILNNFTFFTEICDAIQRGLIYVGTPEIGKRWADLLGLTRIQGYSMCLDTNKISAYSGWCFNSEHMNSNYVYFVKVGHILIDRLFASNKDDICHGIDCVNFDNVTAMLKNSTRISLLTPKVQQRMIHLVNLLQSKIIKDEEVVNEQEDIVI